MLKDAKNKDSSSFQPITCGDIYDRRSKASIVLSTALLIGACFLFSTVKAGEAPPPVIAVQPKIPPSQSIEPHSRASKPVVSPTRIGTINISEKFLLTIIGLVVSGIAIPVIRHVSNRRTERLAFYEFLKLSIKSSLRHYGEVPRSSINDTNDTHYHSWRKPLDSCGSGYPELLTGIDGALQKCISDPNYFPIIEYAGLPPVDLDHNHPLWKLNTKSVEPIANFYIAQKQVRDSIDSLYRSPQYDLITSNDTSGDDRLRWVNAGYSLLGDLSELYISSLNLQKHIQVREGRF